MASQPNSRPAVLNWSLCVLTVALVGLTPTVQALDLGEAFEVALVQDSTLRAARASAAAGRERLPQARSQWLPSVSLSASRNKNKLDSSVAIAPGIKQDSQSDYFSQNQSLSLRQSLFNKAKSADYVQAHFNVADVEALLTIETQNLTVRVTEAYFGALLAEDQLSLLRSQATLAHTQVDAAKKMLAAGAGTRTDIDEVQARLDMNAAQLLEAQQNLDYARQQLSVLMNQPVEQLARLDVQALKLLPPVPATLSQWHALAETGSPELKALASRSEAARLQVEKNQAGHLPTLDLVAQWSVSDSENVTRLNSNYGTRSVGLQLSLPLYAGGAVNSAVRQAVAEHERAIELQEVSRRDLGLRIHKEFRGVTEGVLRIKALEQAVHSAQQMVISNRKSAQAGVRTQLDVLKADALTMEAMRDLAQARYAYLLSRLKLSILAGLAGRSGIDEINGCLVTNQ